MAEDLGSPRGDWEMVSQSSSSSCSKNGEEGFERLNADGTFVFPPSRHEGLPIDSQSEVPTHLQIGPNLPEIASDMGVAEHLEEESGVEFEGLMEVEDETREDVLDFGADSGEVQAKTMDDGCGDFPFKGFREWWRQQSWQPTVVWSFTLGTALVGLLFLGQRWQRERRKNRLLMLELSAKDQKISKLLYQIAALKELASGRRKVPVLRTGSR
eukprot:TRINITY_DN9201_c0_g1_i1.p1 TRINITY_DN9201_c0_g1~~TRINITY_DN9201_c0_g1_i1.p1  ORF type:complete len:213 (-),score=52.28 TRINITY_DN9201_c0_g1_i1:351-989(-)